MKKEITETFEIERIGQLQITFFASKEVKESPDSHPDGPVILEDVFSIVSIDSCAVSCGDALLPLPYIDLKSKFGRELEKCLIEYLEDNFEEIW